MLRLAPPMPAGKNGYLELIDKNQESARRFGLFLFERCSSVRSPGRSPDMSKQASGNPNATGQPAYRSKPLRPHLDDSYASRGKPHGAAACPECGAVFQDGRWSWAARPEAAEDLLCPACRRIQENQPAGYLVMKGDFLLKHSDEILKILHNFEGREKAEHPLQRIIKIAESDGAMQVTTTDTHLARGLGEALHHAYRGELEIRYADDENLVRVLWRR